jgi:TatD DNase family protein
MQNIYVSYCGNITYKNFKGNETVKQTPEDRLLSETDSPFLPPVPYRGKSNEPSYIIQTLKKISEVKEVEYESLLVSLNKNINKLFFAT